MADAVTAVPAYQPHRFPARENINRYLRETEAEGEWYTYALNFSGESIFYVVSDTKPQNICVSITTPDRIITHGTTKFRMSAPALDGVYYGGAQCDSYYLWDAATGNYIELAGQAFTLVTSRVPLALDTDPARHRPAAPADRVAASHAPPWMLSGMEPRREHGEGRRRPPMMPTKPTSRSQRRARRAVALGPASASRGPW